MTTLQEKKAKHSELKAEAKELKYNIRKWNTQVKINRGFYIGEKVSDQEAAEMQKLLSAGFDRQDEIKKEIKVVIAEVKALEAALKKTCPYCLKPHRIMDKTGKMRRHGWNVHGDRRRGQYGGSWHTGPCKGTRYLPLQESPEGSFEALRDMENFKDGVQAQLAVYATNPALQVEVSVREWDKDRARKSFTSDLSTVTNEEAGRYGNVTLMVEILEGFEGVGERYDSIRVTSYKDEMTKLVGRLNKIIADIERDKQTMREAIEHHGWTSELAEFDSLSSAA